MPMISMLAKIHSGYGLWVFIGVVNLLAFLSSVHELSFLFWFLIFACLFLISFRILSLRLPGVMALMACIVGSIRYLLTHNTTMVWDVASFELPNYFDFLSQIRGPFWTYALLPSSFYGISLAHGVLGVAIIYSFSLVLFACSLAELLSLLELRSVYPVGIVIAFLLLTPYNTIFHVGKGDLIAASFMNILTVSAIRLCLPSQESIAQAHEDLRNSKIDVMASILFGALAFLSKTGTVMTSLPLLVLVGQRILTSRSSLGLTRPLWHLPAISIAISVGLSIYFQKYHVFGLPTQSDLGVVRYGANHSLSLNYIEFFSPPNHQNAQLVFHIYHVIIFTFSVLIPLIGVIVHSLTTKILRRKIVLLCLASIFLLSVWFAPFAAQHSIGSGSYGATENLRLVAQPAVSLLIISFM